MNKINFTIDATEVKLVPDTRSNFTLYVEMLDIDVDNILDVINESTIVNHYNLGKLLDEMELGDIIDHFGIDEVLEKIKEIE